MFWFLLESLFTLMLLYAIMGTLVEFRFDKKRRLFLIGLAIFVTFFLDSWYYMHGSASTQVYSKSWITTLVPNFIALFYLSKHRDGSFFFVYLTVSVIASITTFISYIFAYLIPWHLDALPFIFHTALLTGIYFVCRRLFGNRFFQAAKYQGRWWLLYCILPVISIAAWIMYSGASSHYIDIENKAYLPYAGYIYPQDIPLFIGLMFMVLYTVSLILIMITMTYQAEKFRHEKTALSLQGKALRERLQSFEEKDESLSILRHDIRHHLSTLSELIDKREITSAQTYLSQLGNNLVQVKQESFCSNAVINAIISYYSAIAKREEIGFSATVQLYGEVPTDDMDIGTVLSNTLENAFNACMELPRNSERFIELKFVQHNKQFVLDICNSYNGEVQFDAEGFPISHKKGHGIGGRSIFAFIRKYQASFDYSANKGVFSFRLMFSGDDLT